MRFFEYESRRIVQKAGIPVSAHGFAATPAEARRIAEEIGAPTVIKSQVLTGGRMKAGGVKFADTPDEAASHAEEILALEINGHVPRGVLVDSRVAVKQEYYAGVTWDGTRKRPVMIFSPMGGIDIEEVAETHPEKVGRKHLSNLREPADFEAKEVIASTGVTGKALQRLTPIMARLARLFSEYDMTLAEINPLAELEDGSFVAVDAHMDMENEARPRQKKLLEALGVREEETREAREPTEFELAGEKVDGMSHRGVAGNVTEFDGDLGLEIDPLAELEDGSFVAVDAHMDMENEARPRQKKLLEALGVREEETREAREPTEFELAGEKVDGMSHRGVAGNVTEFDGDLGL